MQSDLDRLATYLEPIFQLFYERLLSDPHFSIFFRGDDHVRDLSIRQRESLRQAIFEEERALEERYVRLGRFHHNHYVPYADFALGIDFLVQEVFDILREDPTIGLAVPAIHQFFRQIKEYTAKGYLDALIEQDKHDQELFLASIRQSREAVAGIIERHLLWLRQFAKAVEREDEELLPDLDLDRSELQRWLMSDEAQQYVPLQADRSHLFDLNRRLFTDASNLFYFIKHRHYGEALMLYEKVNRYLLTLNNAVTVFFTRFKVQELVRDPLTGLFNRKLLDDTLNQRVRLAQLSRRPFALVIADIDDFKGINDSHGHLTGDCVLRQVAELMQRYIRSSDTAFRYGGEEFLLLLTDTCAAGAAQLAESLRRAVSDTCFDCNGLRLKVTLSLGVAEMTHEEHPRQLIERADRHLYAAKHRGKNCVVHHPTDAGESANGQPRPQLPPLCPQTDLPLP